MNTKTTPGAALTPEQQAERLWHWLVKQAAAWEQLGIDPRVVTTALLTTAVHSALRLQTNDDAAEWLENVAKSLRAGEIQHIVPAVN